MKGTKKWKRLAALAISTAMLLPQTAAYAQEGQPVEQMEPMEEVESADYLEAASASAQADENGFVINNGILKGYTGTAAEVAIPEGVTGIGNHVFDGRSGLTSISIPSSVTSIGSNAFYGCSGLTGISIPSSVASIGDSAFAGCSGLTDISIPSSVASIGDSAFAGCSGLTGISIPSSVTSISISAFNGCSGLESIKVEEGNEKYDSRGDCNAIIGKENNALLYGCKNTVIPSDVTSIVGSAFYGCSGLTGISIPSSVTSIGSNAFYGCSGLTGISIPSSVTSIGDSAFAGCSGLESIKVEEGNEKYDSRGDCNAIIGKENNALLYGCKNTVIPSDVTSIVGSAFYGCSGLTGISIPSSVTSIGSNAFYGCSGLRDITLPEGVTDIRWFAFYGCSSLTSIEIPNGASIGDFAFYGCSGLTSISIPSSVTSIGAFAFYGCSGLTSISIPSSVTSIEDSAFDGCSGLESIKVEEGNEKYDSRGDCNAIIEKESNALLRGCKNTVIPSSVTSIGGFAFSWCSGLTSISIPSSVTSIGGGAFNGCSGLTSIDIPSSVTSISISAFNGCSGLESIKVEEGNEKYDSRGDCNAIIEKESNVLLCGCKNTVIPSGVTRIEHEAFNGCSGLAGISIPSSVASIGDGAFYGCSGLAGISIPSSVASIGYWTFSGCSSLTSVKIPGSVTSITKQAFSGCSSLTSVEIPSSVISIAWDAFKGCDGLTIYGEEGSYAQTYATGNNIPFQVQALVTAKALSDCQITLGNPTVTYNGTAQTPAITVKDGNNVLKSGTDYTVTYSNNTNAGTAQAAVTGKGGYTGTVTKEFTIACADIARCTASLNADSCVYNGTAQTPAITVKDGNNVLKSGTDYTVTYSNNTNAGTAQAAITGKGNYTGTVTKAFAIQKASQKLSYTESYTKAYGCKPFKLDAKLESGSGKLTYASSNKKVATVKDGKVTVTGTGVAAITVKAAGTANYNEASVKVTVKVTPVKQTVKSVKAVKGRKLTVKWKKDTRATGCQIQYSTDKKFKKGVKTVTVSKSTTTAKTITKLKQGKKYYVRVRSYKSVKVNGKTQKLYGTWSSAKKSGAIKK